MQFHMHSVTTLHCMHNANFVMKTCLLRLHNKILETDENEWLNLAIISVHRVMYDLIFFYVLIYVGTTSKILNHITPDFADQINLDFSSDTNFDKSPSVNGNWSLFCVSPSYFSWGLKAQHLLLCLSGKGVNSQATVLHKQGDIPFRTQWTGHQTETCNEFVQFWELNEQSSLRTIFLVRDYTLHGVIMYLSFLATACIRRI